METFQEGGELENKILHLIGMGNLHRGKDLHHFLLDRSCFKEKNKLYSTQFLYLYSSNFPICITSFSSLAFVSFKSGAKSSWLLGHSPTLDGVERIIDHHLAYKTIVVLVGVLAVSIIYLFAYINPY